MANAERRPARQCPKGHSMDPNWLRCPYCEVEQATKQKNSPKEVVASGGGQKTMVSEVLRKAGERDTKKRQPGAAPGAGAQLGESDMPRIVAVLITYTWRPEGQLFAVREGKNFIGRDKISSETSHRNCDVQIPQDARMSSEHALILCRHGMFEIIDQTSANGTFLNGEMLIANQSTKLPNCAEIKTGDTLWTFFKIEAPPIEAPPTEEESEKPRVR